MGQFRREKLEYLADFWGWIGGTLFTTFLAKLKISQISIIISNGILSILYTIPVLVTANYEVQSLRRIRTCRGSWDESSPASFDFPEYIYSDTQYWYLLCGQFKSKTASLMSNFLFKCAISKLSKITVALTEPVKYITNIWIYYKIDEKIFGTGQVH